MKILLLGSHPSLLEVVPFIGALSKTYEHIFTINNAWSVLRYYPQRWLRSSDFDRLGTIHPNESDLKRMLEVRSSFRQSPKWYTLPGSGTMLLNGLYHIYNTYNSQRLEEIHVLGLDLDYSNSTKTHFYGNGKTNKKTRKCLEGSEFEGLAADPLRFGVEPLREALVKTMSDLAPVKLISLSSNPKQLLPYSRLTLANVMEGSMIQSSRIE